MLWFKKGKNKCCIYSKFNSGQNNLAVQLHYCMQLSALYCNRCNLDMYHTYNCIVFIETILILFFFRILLVTEVRPFIYAIFEIQNILNIQVVVLTHQCDLIYFLLDFFMGHFIDTAFGLGLGDMAYNLKHVQ